MASLGHRIDKWLYRKGFLEGQVRFLLKSHLYLVLVTVPLSWLVSPEWGSSFTVGAMLSIFNFYALAQIIKEILSTVPKGAVVALLTGFYFRLILTGVVIYVMIGPLRSEIVPLLLGLSIVVLNIFLFGAAQVSKKLKEAR